VNGSTGAGGDAGLAGRGGDGGFGGTGSIGATSVNVPLTPNTADQSPGPISISGFAPDARLLVGVSLDNAPGGTTFRFGTIAGLDAGYGYTFSDAMSEISFTGTQAAVDAALASMLISTGSSVGAFTINAQATVAVTNNYYYSPNNHYYQYVPQAAITWTQALNDAGQKILNGATGYLVTITSEDENDFIKYNVNASDIWIAASDAGNEGVWTWRAGPETGQQFWQGNFTGYATAPYYYAGWATRQPDNAGNNEHYGTTNFRGTLGAWNDLPVTYPSLVKGYLVEYSPPVGGWNVGVSAVLKTAEVGNSQNGGIGGTGGNGGAGGSGAQGGTGSTPGISTPGADGGDGGFGGDGGDGAPSAGTGAAGGLGGDGGNGGTGGTGAAGTPGTPGSVGGAAAGDTGGGGGNYGTGGTGGLV